MLSYGQELVYITVIRFFEYRVYHDRPVSDSCIRFSVERGRCFTSRVKRCHRTYFEEIGFESVVGREPF